MRSTGTLTRLVLVLARLGVDEELCKGVEGLEEQLVEEEADDDGLGRAVGAVDGEGGVKAKGGEEGLVVDEDGEDGEGEEEVGLGDEEEAGGVGKVPVAELVGEDGLDLGGGALVEEGVVEDDLLGPGQAVEVGVRVRRALAAVDDVQVLEREAELSCEGLDARAHLAVGQLGELVEERLDPERKDDLEAELDRDPGRQQGGARRAGAART